MSNDTLNAFRARLAESTELQEAAREALKLQSEAPLIEAAKEAGFEISADDLAQITRGELSDVEMELVAAGAVPNCGSSNV